MAKISTGAQEKPTAEVGVGVGKIIVSVGDGYYEVYIDMKMQQPALNYNLTHEYPAKPGEHRVSVYSAGRFVFDQMITVPAEEPEKPEPYVSIKASIIHDLIDEMRDIAALLEAIIAAQKPQEAE